ncbi:MAG: hypothetical protein B6D77_11275 [gamma proteobacterium symbiont of Ctena orbiculata]|nr:MAG: hypothetical protein B6D77_11275 [gamma proteobacterium symbiont of Ctena orbiculata]PVV19525.1 MAG: hypothetical protein B6D78_13265 [gamma proteobacterium symbiont of Ctena orbiculata]PVV26576.1 MAG: hypothetical protein B6D79_05830 [gamma proteobacterium symbiont of Ctena orbiculata]
MAMHRKVLYAQRTPVQYQQAQGTGTTKRVPLSGQLFEQHTIILDRNASAGLLNPRNLGPCNLVIISLDRSGRRIERDQMFLRPGEKSPFYKPPPGVAKIVAVPTTNQDQSFCAAGRAVLEYDIPVF